MTTFRCPLTGLELDRPPATQIRDEYLHLAGAGAHDRTTTLAHHVHHGHWTRAATTARHLADYLAHIDDNLHDLNLDIDAELDPWPTHDHEDTTA